MAFSLILCSFIRSKLRHRFLLVALAFIGSFITPLTSSNTHAAPTNGTPCSAVDIQTLEKQLLGLSAIEESFKQLASGVIHQELSLTSLFTIDLVDQQAVEERRAELRTSHTRLPSTCPSEELTQIIEKRQSALNNITAIRLKYLSLPLDDRHYLVSLVNIYQKLSNNLTLLENNERQFTIDLEELKESITDQEAKYKSLQSADDRAVLFEKINQTKDKLQALSDIYEQDKNTIKLIRPLLALSKALLIDYHNIYQISFHHQEAKNSSDDLFRKLTSPEDLNSLIRISSDQEQHSNSYKTELAALIIIHGRIHTRLRQQEPISKLVSNGVDGILQKLNIEVRTLLALPSANIHLKLSPNGDLNYLSQTLFQSATNLAMQLLLLLAFGVFLRRLPHWINTSQRYIARNHLAKTYSRPMINTLRFFQPNSQWLAAISLYYYLDSKPDNTLRDWVIIYDVTAIAAFYLLIKTIASGAISNTNSQAHLFVLQSKQLNIKLQCHRFALYTTLASVFYIFLETLLKGGIICTVYQLFLLIIIWFFSYRTISVFQPEFITHLSKNISEQWLLRFNHFQKPFIKGLLNPIVFVLLQLVDIISAIHHQLLKLERYQTLTAKFLKIRLEQSQSNTQEPEKEEQDDTHYENWFSNNELVNANPNLLVPSPWLQELTQNVTNWLENKQDENDLALIGESGIGKSVLVKQWIEQWKSSKAIYIQIPSKTLKEQEIFRLVCEALEFKDCEEIASFVTQQQTIEKTVIIIDEAQHLFLSDVGGFEAYKKLQDLISAKLNNIFWVIAINHQSWIYLNDVFSRTYQFSTSINMQRWSQQGIRDLVLRRHKASRRKLSFDELLLASTSHSETATRAAESRCFSLLWDQSSGIPSVALSIWMNSTRNPAKGLIEMGVPERPNNNALQHLSDDHLFVYAALIIHESLNTQQAHAVTHLSEAIVRRTLKHGLDQGFLKRESHGRYIINPLWQIQLCQLLRRKNFLHE